MCFSLFIVVQRYLNTTIKSESPYRHNTIGNRYTRQARAASEGVPSYGLDMITDGDICQTSTSTKACDTFNTIRDRDARERPTISKGTPCNSLKIIA